MTCEKLRIHLLPIDHAENLELDVSRRKHSHMGKVKHQY